MNKSRYQRFALIKKSIEFRQGELYSTLTELQAKIEKKEKSIDALTLYLRQYEKKMETEETLSHACFMNQQSFIDQIAQALLQETEENKTLCDEKMNLMADYMKHRKKIEVISENLIKCSDVEDRKS